MSVAFRAIVALPVTALLGAAGCSSPESPLEPSAGGRGVTIQGTVQTSAGASTASARPSAAGPGITISVVGTNLSTTTDSSGRFVIEGIRAGAVTLRFQGPGVDATLQISGLVEGQKLTITVQVAGSQAALVGKSEVEFKGAIESITPPTLLVSGQKVVTDAATEIKRGNARIGLSDLRVKETVKVEGSLQADGSVLAREIEVAAPAGARVDFTGVIESITPPELIVSKWKVRTDANTKFKGKGRTDSLADFWVGDTVRVEGTVLSDGTVLASEIDRREQAPAGAEVKFEGKIDAVTPPTLKVSGRTVVTDSGTKIEKDGKQIALSELKVGERVKVEGTRMADGSVLAKKIEAD